MTHHIAAMLDAHPQAAETPEKAECIAACFQCAQTCIACADACVAEDMVADLASCIRSDLDCPGCAQCAHLFFTLRRPPNRTA